MNDLTRLCFPETEGFELERTLLAMDAKGVIVYRPNDRSICYDVHAQRINSTLRKKIRESSSGRRSQKLERLDKMIEYGGLRSCLREYLLSALGDDSQEAGCGFCDNCI